MLSDDELRNVYELASSSYFESHKPDMDFDDMSGLAGLRAVEAAVRADQIARDAEIADNRVHPNSKLCEVCAAVAAIRAQLTEGNTDE